MKNQYFVGGNTVAVDDHDSILTHTVSILNLDKGTWRTSYDGQLPAIKPFPIKLRSLTLKNVNGDIYAFGGHDGTNPLDTILQWNSEFLFGDWVDTTLTIPEAAEDPIIIPYNSQGKNSHFNLL